MKIHTFAKAPNPRRVHVYLAEKGIELERVDVDLLGGETRGAEFRAKNPMGTVPVLELDDGSFASESLAIIEYLEERHPEPPMLGTTPEDRLRARELERICEQGVLHKVATVLQHTHPFFAKAHPQTPAVADSARASLERSLDVLEGRIGPGPFLLGERPMIPDCTLFAALSWAFAMGLKLDLSARPKLTRFNAEFRQRPSSKA
ncbi:MAG: glutathione S-transferase family protein [Deltaproteobacteria bacterium]|nr:glutathione S-transferase family protein [Deltaproteobacteria bacterium]